MIFIKSPRVASNPWLDSPRTFCGAANLNRCLPPFDVEPFWRRDLFTHGMPAMDISELAEEYRISAELPGVDAKDIEIKLVNGNLLIRGEKKEEVDEKRKEYHLSERHYGSFERVFQLPRGVDAEKIDAQFDKGVLLVHLPKRAEAIHPEKVIPIKSGK